MQVRGADRTITDRMAQVDGLALTDPRQRISLLTQGGAAIYEARSASRFMPWITARPFVAWAVGDAEPMSLHLPERDYRADGARVTESDRMRLNDERTDLALVDVSRPEGSTSPWRLFARVVCGAWVLVGVMALIEYWRSGAVFGIGA
ncbi:MAG: hypothetical protein VW518_04315 [Burkholderiaceae bacterium]